MGLGRRVLETHESEETGALRGRDALEGLLQALSGSCQGHGEMGSVLSWEEVVVMSTFAITGRCLLEIGIPFFVIVLVV